MNIRVFTAFHDLPAALRSQLSYPSEPNVFLSLDWFELLFETSLRTTLTPRLYLALDADDKVRGSLYCGVAHDARRTLHSLTNFYSLQYLPGFAQGPHDPTAVDALVAHIASERPRWDRLRLTTMIDGEPEAAWLNDGLRDNGFRIQRYFQYENWYTRLDGQSFDTYFAQRPSQLRNTVTRKQKKLEKLHKVQISLARGESPDLERMVADFNAVYAVSWKQPEPFPAFIPALVARCASLGVLRLGVLYLDGLPAAAQLWITAGGKALIYKLAYDEKYAQLGVGSVLSRELFRVALDEDHVTEIDYGVGSEAYKKDWMTAVRLIRGTEGYNARTVTGLALAAWSDAKSAVKRWRPAPKQEPSGAAP